MSRRLIVRPEAEGEMADAFDWYEDRVSGLGSEFLLCVDAVFSSILRSPHQYAQRDCPLSALPSLLSLLD